MSATVCLTAAALVVTPLVVAAPAAAATTLSPVIVTELVADNVGYDHYEYVEVRNTTGAPLDLAAAGITFAYSYADAADARTVPLEAEPLVLAADETAILWVSYQTDTVDSFARTVDDFKQYHSVAPETQVVRLTGQAGMANGGDRGIQVLQAGAVASWSHAPAGGFGVENAVHFRVPADAADLGLDVLSQNAQRSPGFVLPEALVPAAPEPDPEPTPDPAGDTDAAAWPLIVTEIAPDNTGVDNFEYFEVHNPTDAAIDLDAEGISFSYIYVDSDDRSRDVALTVAEPTTIAAGETVVFWLSYTATGIDSFAKTVDEFRTEWSAPQDTRVVRVTGQAGMANSAPRGIRVLDGDEVISWSTYGRTATAPSQTAHFRIPADTSEPGMELLADPAAPSPGTVDAAALTFPAFDPQPDPSIVTAPLQITEVLPDSANVGGADGYEFIEVYNATSAPIDFSDYSINYLYPDTGASLLWPALPSDVVIEGGSTLTFWIKNGANDALTAADFNAKFGTDLVMGETLVEIDSAGMANGSARGVEIVTNTGYTVSRAYYNVTANPDGSLRDDVHADQGIRYTPSEADASAQRLIDWQPATPGTVQRDQVPAGLMIVNPDAAAPVITDLTAAEIEAGTDFAISFGITDDVQPRTTTLTLANSADDQPLTINLTDAGDGTFSHVVNAADLMGKRWYEYTVTVTDGTNVASTETRRVALAGVDTSPVRLNLTDGQFVGGTVPVVAAGDHASTPIDLTIDAKTVQTAASLESQPLFVFEATNVNYYFKNGVRVGGTPDGDILSIFDTGTNGWETIVTTVPLEYVIEGDELVLSVWAGSKKAPEIDDLENNDNFDIRGLRLVLPDGRTLTPEGYDDPSTVIGMGDNDANPEANTLYDVYDARFVLPDDAFAAQSYEWDTTEHTDGAVTLTATDGTTLIERDVLVDNTAPRAEIAIVDQAQGPEGSVLQGTIGITATVVDQGSDVASVTATLDGVEVALTQDADGAYVFETSSVELEAGVHEVVVTATDGMGNASTTTAEFETYLEQPSAGALAPLEGDQVHAGEVTLQAKVEDPTGDVLDVAFLEGRRVDLADGDIEAQSGTVNDAEALERDDAEVLSDAQLRTLADVDGVSDDVTSDAEFPYQLFDVAVGDADPGAQVRSTWSGRANTGASVIYYVQRADASGWDEVDRHTALADDEAFELTAVVDVDTYAVDGVVRMLVQHSEGFAGENLSDRDTVVTPHNAEDVARSEYDFTFAWESDTQYYNENTVSEDALRHQRAIHDYVLDRREEMNLQYMFHTGDIIDDYDQMYQWENADPEYQKLDDAGLPYGVLAGNHDVANELQDYTNFGTYFGADRFEGNPWYGGTYENNRGHYDLISAGGIDFIMLYTGWLPDDASIAWMNEVLAQFPDRVAIIAQHEFILTTGGLGAIPQRVLDEVVATNPNVRMVLSGHYHDAYTRTDSFDDDGDGVNERTVYSMLFDYQGLPEGGLGYLRLLHFDNEGERMMVRTYSPSLDDYNSDDASLADAPQEFELTYEQLGISTGVRTLGTDAFSAEILEASEIASFEDVPSGSIVSATWSLAEVGERGWYVRSADAFGGVDLSPVTLFEVLPAIEPEPEEPGIETPEPETPGGNTGDPDAGGNPVGGSSPVSGGEPASDAQLAATGTDGTAVLPWTYGALALIAGGLGALALAIRRRGFGKR